MNTEKAMTINTVCLIEFSFTTISSLLPGSMSNYTFAPLGWSGLVWSVFEGPF